MASYNELNALIDAYINRNGVQAITGQILNGVLKAMVEQLGRGYTIMGAATPTTDPGTPDGPECYFASEVGTYTDFDGLQIVPGELALLCYTPSDGWTKATIYEGFQTVQASIDGNVGTPSVGVSYANGVLSFDFHNMKGNPGQNGQDGQDGDPAGFGTIGADITGGVGTPGVSVESSGPATAKNLQFHFTNLKGETGVTSVVVTVDNTTGTPTCTASLSGGVLTLAFTGLKGAQGNPGSSIDYPFTLVNNLTTDDPDQALTAAMGVQLESEISQLEHEVHNLSGKYYGLFEYENELPEGEAIGYAFVGIQAPFAIYQFDGEEWEDSGATVTSIYGEPGVGFESAESPTPADGTVEITLTNGDKLILDLNHNHPQYYGKDAETEIPSGGFLPDVVYILGELSGSVTFSLASAVTGNINHYFWTFSTGASAPTVTFPTGITWAAGSAPGVSANKHYEISILDGIAYYSEV